MHRRFQASRRVVQPIIQALERRQLLHAPFGRVDPTFGVDGAVITSIPGPSRGLPSPTQITVQNGLVYEASDQGIARFKQSGTLDTTYGASGLVLEDFNAFVQQAVDLQNRLYVLTQAQDGPAKVEAFAADGSVRTSFGSGGTVTASTDSRFAADSVATQADGKIVVLGTLTESNGAASVELLRFDVNGTVDSTFGTAGVVVFRMLHVPTATEYEVDDASQVAALPHGDLLVSGVAAAELRHPEPQGSSAFAGSQAVLARFTPDGSLDVTFGRAGFTRSKLYDAGSNDGGETSYQLATELGVATDGSSVIIGITRNIIFRYAADGTLRYRQPLQSSNSIDGYDAEPGGVAVLADGRAVILRGFGHAGLTMVSPNGKDQRSVRNDVESYYAGRSTLLAVGADGEALVGVADDTHFGLEKVYLGSVHDPRPDDFANGTVNALTRDGYGNYTGTELVYYDTAAATLKYAHEMASGLWSGPRTIPGTAGADQSVSIAHDVSGNPLIAFYDSQTRTLKMAQSKDDGRHFTIETVDPSGDVGPYCSLVVNQWDGYRASIAYYDQTHGNLKIATRQKHRWVSQAIDTRGDVGSNATLLVSDESHELRVAYVDRTGGAVKYGQRASDGRWHLQPVAAAPGGADALSMVDGFGDGEDENALYYTYAISYRDLATDELKLVYSESGSDEPPRTLVTLDSKIAPDAVLVSSNYDKLTVITHHPSDDALHSVAQQVGGPDVDEGIILTHGGTHLSLVQVRLLYPYAVIAYTSPASRQLHVRDIELTP